MFLPLGLKSILRLEATYPRDVTEKIDRTIKNYTYPLASFQLMIAPIPEIQKQDILNIEEMYKFIIEDCISGLIWNMFPKELLEEKTPLLDLMVEEIESMEIRKLFNCLSLTKTAVHVCEIWIEQLSKKSAENIQARGASFLNSVFSRSEIRTYDVIRKGFQNLCQFFEKRA